METQCRLTELTSAVKSYGAQGRRRAGSHVDRMTITGPQGRGSEAEADDNCRVAVRRSPMNVIFVRPL